MHKNKEKTEWRGSKSESIWKPVRKASKEINAIGNLTLDFGLQTVKK